MPADESLLEMDDDAHDAKSVNHASNELANALKRPTKYAFGTDNTQAEAAYDAIFQVRFENTSCITSLNPFLSLYVAFSFVAFDNLVLFVFLFLNPLCIINRRSTSFPVSFPLDQRTASCRMQGRPQRGS